MGNPIVITVTLNPAVDRTMVVPGFQEGSIHRAWKVRNSPGGKGINVSRILRQLGTPSIAFALAAGHIGLLLLDLLRQEGLDLEFVFLEQGETRMNITILNSDSGSETKINEPGPPVAPEILEELVGRIERLVRPGAWVVLSGSLPPGVPSDIYANLIRRVQGRGGAAVLDASGAPLVCGLRARPQLIKPNREELEELGGRPFSDAREAAGIAKALAREWGCQVLLSLDREGAGWTDGREVWWARVPPVRIRQSVGAGDALLAAFLDRQLRGSPPWEALRFASALATAVTLSGEVARFHEEDFHRVQVETSLERWEVQDL